MHQGVEAITEETSLLWGGNEILTFNRPFYTTACLTSIGLKVGNRIYVVLFASILEGYVRT